MKWITRERPKTEGVCWFATREASFEPPPPHPVNNIAANRAPTVSLGCMRVP